MKATRWVQFSKTQDLPDYILFEFWIAMVLLIIELNFTFLERWNWNISWQQNWSKEPHEMLTKARESEEPAGVGRQDL